MPRRSPGTVLPLLVIVLACLALSPPARADAFDHYTNPILTRLLDSKNVKELKQLTPADIVDHDRVLPALPAAFVVVKTSTGRTAKLLIQVGRQKVGARSLPVLLVERYVTFKEGEEQTRLAEGRNLTLFPGFRLSLDLGQVVPEVMGGDLRFVAEPGKVYAQPVGKAKLFLVTKALPDAAPKKGKKFVMGEKFEPRYFTGTFKLHDDGRRSGTLKLKVAADGRVSGAYYSDKDGSKYEVVGRVGTPAWAIDFRIKFPRTEQTFRGLLFTGTGRAIAGTSRLVEREAGFYALRVEE
jgi:hypothetical protein